VATCLPTRFLHHYLGLYLLIAGLASYGNYEWNYDGKGRLISTVDPQGRTLNSMPIDPACNSSLLVVSQVTDDRGFTRSTETDLLGQKRVLIDQLGQETDYAYDGDGHLIQTLQAGQIRSYAYNGMGWLLSREEPEEGGTAYSNFNLLGIAQLITHTGRLGASQESTLLHFDGHLRLDDVKAIAGATISVHRTLTYEPTFYTPKTIAESQPYGTITENYVPDSLGRTQSKTVTDGTQTFTVSQSLDALGHVKALTYPAGGSKSAETVNFGFDNYARPNSAMVGSTMMGSYDYGEGHLNSDGFDSVLSFGTGLASTVTTFGKGELTKVVQNYVGGSASTAVSWTAGGLMLTRGSDQFDYDALQRLVHANSHGVAGTVDQKFSFDRWGNRSQNRWSGTQANEVICWNATYDATNSLPGQVMLVDPVTGNPQYAISTGAIYDDLGRLISVNAIPGNSASSTQWSYDASGRVVNENGTTFLLDSEGLRFKRNVSTTLRQKAA